MLENNEITITSFIPNVRLADYGDNEIPVLILTYTELESEDEDGGQ